MSKLFGIDLKSRIKKYYKKGSQCTLLNSEFFTINQMLTITTPNYYSILYYNAEFWFLPKLSPQSKQKCYQHLQHPWNSTHPLTITWGSLHLLNKRATPSQVTTYKHILILHKLYNIENTSNDRLSLFFNQRST